MKRNKTAILSVIALITAVNCGLTAIADGNTLSVSDFLDYETDLGLGTGKLQGHWAEASKDIQILMDEGGIKGIPYGDGFIFQPNRPIKTNEMLSLIINAWDGGANMVQADSWSESIMKTAENVHIIDSSENTEEIAQSYLTREKMAKILETTNKLYYVGGGVRGEYKKDAILDLNQADEVYRAEIHAAYEHGLVQGSDGLFRPKDTVTRAEACAIVNRLFKYTSRLEIPDSAKPTPAPAVEPGSLEARLAEYEKLFEKYPELRNDPDTLKMLEDDKRAYAEAEEQKTNPSKLIKEEIIGEPKEGDIFNGKEVTRDPETGVLGFGNGQTGGLYLGSTKVKTMQYTNTGETKEFTSTVEDGTLIVDNCIGVDGLHSLNHSPTYTTQGKYTYWDFEWEAIYKVAEAKLEAYKQSMGGKVNGGTLADIHGNILSTEYINTESNSGRHPDFLKLLENYPDAFFYYDAFMNQWFTV